jgi:sulfur-oxidizing protein SoxY
MQRRDFLKSTAVGSAVALGSSLLPQTLLAAWPEAAFKAKSVDEALSALLGSTEKTESGDINIKAPDIAENGAVVPIQVTTTLPNVESISIIAEKKPRPADCELQLW